MTGERRELSLSGDAEAVREVFEEMPLTQSATDGPEHRFIAANAAYRSVAGRSDLIGKTLRESFPDLTGQQIFEMYDRVYTSGESQVGREWRFQFDRRAGGEPEVVFVDFVVAPRRNAAGDVIGLLTYASDVTGRVLQRQAAERQNAEAERRYQAAREVVAELQKALLPSALPVLPAVTTAARYLVAAEDQAAGGDWFDALPLSDGRLALIVGDIVGHGMAASAAMGQARAVLDELLLETGDLELALRWVDRMAARSSTMRAATVCVVVLDPATGALRYSTCGHPPPLLISPDGAARYLAPSGAGPLGTGSAPSITSDTLTAGAVLLLYSDGLIERPGQPLTTGMDRLAAVAGDAVANRVTLAGASASAAERACQHSVELLTREGYDDDVTVLAAQRRPAAVAPLRHELTARPNELARLREAMRAWLGRLPAGPDDERAVDLAVTELVANGIEHAYPPGPPGPIRVHGALGADGVLQIEVADDGTWQVPAGPKDTSGRGLWMVGAVVDDLQVDNTGSSIGNTVITLQHRLSRPAEFGSIPRHSSARRPAMEFSTTVEPGPPPQVVRVSGSLDITTAAAFADRLDVTSRGGVHPIIVDLTDVDVLASAGVSVLFAARDRHAVHEQPLVIVAAPDSVPAQILDLVGLSYTSEHVPGGPPA